MISVPQDALDRLEGLARTLRADNPTMTFLVDSGCVWLRQDGTDYGIYSYAIDGRIVKTLEGRTAYVWRPTPVEVRA